MKRSGSLIFITLISFSLLKGQGVLNNEASRPTKLESVLITKGALIIKEFVPLEELRSTESGTTHSIQAVTLTVPGKTEETIRGLKISIVQLGSPPIGDSSFLDMEEIDNVLNALDYIISLAAEWESNPNMPYTEAVYTTTDNFKVAFTQQKKKRKAFMYVGLSEVGLPLKIEGLSELKSRIQEGKALLLQN